MSLQILVRLIAAHFGNQWFIEKQAVTKFLCGCTHRSIDIPCGQTMHRKSVNQPQGHRLVLFSGNSIFNTRFEYLTTFDDSPDFRERTE